MFAVLYLFGLECGVGADKLSRFFKLIRIEKMVGVSPSALRTRLQQMEQLLPQFQADCEKQVKKQTRKAVVAKDETFFGDFLILVLMDLRSGYLLLEEISDDRRFETWYAKTAPRLEALGIEVNHAISDRAKALIKLAISGWDCESGADIFHAQQDVSRCLDASLARKERTAEQQVEAAQTADNQLTDSATHAAKAIHCLDVVNAEATRDAVRQAREDYHENLQGVADDLHPFSLTDSGIHTAKTVETALENRAQAFQKITHDQAIADKKDRLTKFRNQMQALAVTVDFWGLWVRDTLQGLEVNPVLEDWLITILLPVVYWHHQRYKTQNRKARERTHHAWQKAVQAFETHPVSSTVPASEIQRWLTWAEAMARQFHRSSSAVEGRNGCLAQMYHQGRGLSQQRLAALTVIHNYGIQREDGSTAAMRLFETDFPDLFGWLLGQMGELPLPRKARGRVAHNPLIFVNVPA